MPILAIFAPLLQFLFREVAVKFLVLTAVFAVMAVLVPKVIELATPHIGVTALNNAFGGLDGGVWFFLDFFALDYGLPLLLSAFVARFLIRRLPLVG